eukprot:gene6614-9081_t
MPLINFKLCWVLFYLMNGFICGSLISIFDGIPWLDGIFVALSSCTGSSLSTVSTLDLSVCSIVLTALLSIIGSPVSMLLITSLYRRECFYQSQLHAQKINPITTNNLTIELPLDPIKIKMIQEYHLLDESLGFLNIIFIIYSYTCIGIGGMVIYGALWLRPNQIELTSRGFNRMDSAVFLSITSFCNTGLALTSDNVVGLANNPFVSIILGALVILGNTGLPIILRLILLWINKFGILFISSKNQKKYQHICSYILRHPGYLSTHIFSTEQTKTLSIVFVFIILVLFIGFILGSVNNPNCNKYYSNLQLICIGFYQALSLRAAGFEFINLRLLNTGTLVVYAAIMYVSSFPLMSHTQAVGDKSYIYQHRVEKLLQQSSTNNYHNHPPHLLPFFKSFTMKVMKKMGLRKTSKIVFKDNKCNSLHNIHFNRVDPEYKLWNDNNKNNEDNFENELNKNSLPITNCSTESNDDIDDDHCVNPLHSSEGNNTFIQKLDYYYDHSTVSVPNKTNHNENNEFNDEIQILHYFIFKHSFFLVIAIIICAYSENHLLSSPTSDINLWYIIFEGISAYGNIGLSMGLPGKSYSLSGAFSPVGKLVIMFLMLLGKHRRLPSKDDIVRDFSFEEYISAWS